MPDINFTPPKAPLKLFGRIGAAFIGLTVILLAIVMYMTLSRATILVQSKEEEVSADLLTTVRQNEPKDGDIAGRVGSVTVSREASFPVLGEGIETTGKSSGEAIVYNNHTAPQTLIATTRFLSEKGVLFRLQKTITVPAGKTVTAFLTADKEGAEGDIGPSAFTIPGLNASLQKKIFAKSAGSMTGGIIRASVITEKDVDEAAKNIKSLLSAEASEKLRDLLNKNGLYPNIAYFFNVKNQKTDIKIGDKADKFKLKLELEAIGVVYGAGLQDQAAKTLSGMIASDRKLVSSNIMELQPVIEKYDLDAGTTALKTEITGKTVITETSPIFDKDKLAGMSAEEAEAYLEKYPGISGVNIDFFPFWLNKIPRLKDHIKVIVQ